MYLCRQVESPNKDHASSIITFPRLRINGPLVFIPLQPIQLQRSQEEICHICSKLCKGHIRRCEETAQPAFCENLLGISTLQQATLNAVVSITKTVDHK